jgi:hypothetical protein
MFCAPELAGRTVRSAATIVRPKLNSLQLQPPWRWGPRWLACTDAIRPPPLEISAAQTASPSLLCADLPGCALVRQSLSVAEASNQRSSARLLASRSGESTKEWLNITESRLVPRGTPPKVLATSNGPRCSCFLAPKRAVLSLPPPSSVIRARREQRTPDAAP